MDYQKEIEEVKKKLFELGFSEEKYNQLLEMAAQEALHKATEQLQEKGDLETLQEKLIENPSTKEEAIQNVNLIFNTAYGEKSEDMQNTLVLEYLKETAEVTEKSKDLVKRYAQGDPTAVAQIDSNKDNPELEEILDQKIPE